MARERISARPGDAPAAALLERELVALEAKAGGELRAMWPAVIATDAPPPMENCRAFVQVAVLLREADVHAPEVHAQDLDRGFLLLEDLGTVTYLAHLDASNAPALYLDAIDNNGTPGGDFARAFRVEPSAVAGSGGMGRIERRLAALSKRAADPRGQGASHVAWSAWSRQVKQARRCPVGASHSHSSRS